MSTPSSETGLRGLLRTYARALREEPKYRNYLAGSVIDDVGVAVSAWAGQLIMVNLFTSQRERAKLMIPTLLCFFLGCLIAGPLADWGRGSLARLARWRWRLVIWARLVETLALGLAMWAVAGEQVTLGRMLPYFLISAFMKTALRPTRRAFEVDMLSRQETQRDENGVILCDERGEPRQYKLHMLPCESLNASLRMASVFGGLLLGGQILGLVHGRYLPLLGFDVLTNLAYIAVVFFACHPNRSARTASLRDLFRDEEKTAPLPQRAAVQGRSLLGESLQELGESIREVLGFLRNEGQRPLLFLLAGAWLIEVITEFYNGKMLVKHVLHGSDTHVRWAEISWSLVALSTMTLMPLLTRKMQHLGKIFLFTMLLDGMMIAVAGRISAAGSVGVVLPFIAILSIDHALTATSSALADLAMSNASSPAIRGRITAVFALVVIVSNLAAEIASTAMSESYGIPGMLLRIGIGQIVFMVAIAAIGGRRLWTFGLRTTSAARVA